MNVPGRGLSDAALLARARAGDDAAVTALYAKHTASARRLATILVGPEGAEDLVSDGFTRVLTRLRNGEGPVDDFRSYLFATVRNRHRDQLRQGHREEPASDRPWILDEVHPAVDAPLDEYDVHMIDAFRALPVRWQYVLWQLAVEGRPVTEVADELALSPSALTSLASRARQGLRRAYLERGISVLDRTPEDPALERAEPAARPRAPDAVRDAS